MRANLFGVGTRSESWAITSEKRINCVMDVRKDGDRTMYALMARPGLTSFTTGLGASPSRGMWAVNTLAQPLLFTVHGGTLYSVTNAGVISSIGAIGTLTGDVSMVDNGTYLMLVDGVSGYYYNMIAPAGLNQITDGNFTTSPKYVTWQETYFIVTSGRTNQFQLSNNSDPTTWPAVNINFTGSSAGALQAGIADHGTLMLFGPDYTEFWQDTGAPDFPYAVIPGAAQEFGLISAWSLAKYDNSVAGLFRNKQGGAAVARMSGFALQKISSHDIDEILSGYSTVADADGIGMNVSGHSLYVANLPTQDATWAYDGLGGIWSQWQSSTGSRYRGHKFANFVNRLLVSDYSNGNIYTVDPAAYTDNGDLYGMEVWSKHIWDDDKWLTIDWIQIDMEQGTGLATGQGSIPVIDLWVSKDGGQSFRNVGYGSVGKIGEYTTRTKWSSLGAARDWVIRLRITDPVKRVITGASADIRVGSR